METTHLMTLHIFNVYMPSQEILQKKKIVLRVMLSSFHWQPYYTTFRIGSTLDLKLQGSKPQETFFNILSIQRNGLNEFVGLFRGCHFTTKLAEQRMKLMQ